MFRAFACLTEQHTFWLVTLAGAVCWFSSHTGLRVLKQAGHNGGELRELGWLLAASFAIGAGIWSTHFIAMLGYDPGVIVGFDVEKTLLSLLVAIVGSLLSLLVLRLAKNATVSVSAGVILGLSISAMHYLGMAGVLIPGRFSWDTSLVAFSIFTAIALSSISLVVFVRQWTRWPTVAAAIVLTLAIVTLHFTGMAAAEAVPELTITEPDGSIPKVGLALGIAAAMLGIVGFSALALFAERLRRANEDLRHNQHALSCKTDQLDAALSNMSQGLCMYDAKQRLVLCNRRFSKIFNLPADAITSGMHLTEVLEAQADAGNFERERLNEILAKTHSVIEEGASFNFLITLSDDRIIAISHGPMESGGWVATYEDVSERKRTEERMAHMAHHDALTGLPNRVLFREELVRALDGLSGGEKLSVLCLDLDQFKGVNDTLGHPIGDTLLRTVAARLRGCVRESDRIARLGGDEFAIIQVAVQYEEESSLLAQRVIDTLAEPYMIDGHQVVIGASVGIALAPIDSDDPDLLLKRSDMALYRAKADGRGRYHFFEVEMDAKMQARRALEVDLRGALTSNEFEVFYQPIVNIETGEVSTFEALLRWDHPRRGMVPPSDFIPLAEEIGLIGRIGAWVLKQACAEAATWPQHVKIAVNLSPAQFESRTLVLDVAAALGTSGLPGHRLELEITETVMLQDTEKTLSKLKELQALGVRISMDDFGTGFSSLSHLAKFPFDKIKIDRSFVNDITASVNSLAIVRAVTGLGLSLGIATTAEGVETEEQLVQLRSEGCTEVQGYLFSPARPGREVAGLLLKIAYEANQRVQCAENSEQSRPAQTRPAALRLIPR